ncbi:MAG: hypothetical protein ACLFUF_05365, partial [Opitutales bacterium]
TRIVHCSDWLYARIVAASVCLGAPDRGINPLATRIVHCSDWLYARIVAASNCLGAPDRGINPLATGLGFLMRLRPASAGADALARRGGTTPAWQAGHPFPHGACAST